MTTCFCAGLVAVEMLSASLLSKPNKHNLVRHGKKARIQVLYQYSDRAFRVKPTSSMSIVMSLVSTNPLPILSKP